jgi:protein involved in temperature-dependent protein secretion
VAANKLALLSNQAFAEMMPLLRNQIHDASTKIVTRHLLGQFLAE